MTQEEFNKDESLIIPGDFIHLKNITHGDAWVLATILKEKLKTKGYLVDSKYLQDYLHITQSAAAYKIRKLKKLGYVATMSVHKGNVGKPTSKLLLTSKVPKIAVEDINLDLPPQY